MRQISKPGALRAGINYYAAVWHDMEDHKEAAKRKLDIPILALGGESSYAERILEAWRPLGLDVHGGVIKEAGHWPADENPAELVHLLLEFLDREDLPQHEYPTSASNSEPRAARHH